MCIVFVCCSHVVRCLLFDERRCCLCVACCVLFVVCMLLQFALLVVVCCLLFVVCCLLLVVWCVFRVACFFVPSSYSSVCVVTSILCVLVHCWRCYCCVMFDVCCVLVAFCFFSVVRCSLLVARVCCLSFVVIDW